MSLFSRLTGYFGRFNSIADSTGTQNPAPGTSLVPDTANVGVDSALQLSTVWGCIDRRATTIASLPFFTYESSNGQRTLARTSRLYQLLHESPNSRMTPFEFWRAIMLNYDLRGNGYARLERDAKGEVYAMWPMAADQVEVKVLDDGSMVYMYYLAGNVAILSADNVLHLKNLGNGTTGLAKLDYMRPALDEAAKAQTAANKVFGSGGKPTGILMIDRVLTPEQRKSLKDSFGGLAEGSTSRLQILEANMKYEQISMSPEDQQLLETRKFSVEEICRWFDVPPVLVHHSNVTAWGTGIEQIVDGFHKFTIRPMLVNIEQAVRKRVLTPRQRAVNSIEFALDALLRGSLKDRMAIYAQATQNGIYTRNEARQLENLPPNTNGGDELTAQSNLVPLALLGKVKGATNGSTVSTQDPIAN
jgi:HK97 family phage portal protein